MAPNDNENPETTKSSSGRLSIRNLLRSSKRSSKAAVAKSEVKKVEPIVLPKYVTPTKYNLSLTPNLSGDFKFKGSVDISITLTKSGLKEIALHSFELELHTATYVDDNGVNEAVDFVHDAELSTVTCKFNSVLAEGPGVLRVSFTGLHNNQMAGFYRSGYTDAEGVRQIMVTTQFEPLSARRCFPCVDEPAVKAIFTASLIVDAKLTVLGNMPESSSEFIRSPTGKLKKVTFQPTPLMSTYLLAFCVGEFDYVSTTTDHGVLVRVYTPPTKRHLGNFALDAGKRCLDLFDDAFGTPYPLPKLDMVAIPEFSAGAMENWGLVTYRETALLIDEQRSSSQMKQRVCAVVAHELAHQWFGNLVTMEWWDDLWLNEGFARWMQFYASNHLYPSWSMWEQFVVDTQATALKLDALTSSHPIQVPIEHAEEVNQVFDAISYAKGGCAVRMLFGFLGKENFIKGLQLYMARHKYSNTRTSDLWAAWQEASGKPVPTIMKSWTEQLGFPVVSAKRIVFSNGQCTMDLEQEWFLADGSRPKGIDSKLWSIPLLIAIGQGNGADNVIVHDAGLMTTRSMTVSVPAESGSKWARLNAGQHVPMRVHYQNQADLVKLAVAVVGNELSIVDRAGLVMDAYALTRAGRMDAGDLIELLSSFKNEDTMMVWEAISQALTGLSQVLQDDIGVALKFKTFAKSLIADAAARVGWSPKADDGHVGTLLRAKLVKLQESYMGDDENVIAEANARFDKYVADPTSHNAVTVLPTDMRSSVYRLVLGKDGSRLTQLRELLANADTATERIEVYAAVGSTPSEQEKIGVLDWTTSGEVLLQDFMYPIQSVSSSGLAGRNIAWAYMKKNFDRIYGLVATSSPALLAHAVTMSSSGFNTNEAADEIEAFFKEKNVSTISRRVQQIIEDTRGNALFRGRVLASDKFHAALV